MKGWRGRSLSTRAALRTATSPLRGGLEAQYRRCPVASDSLNTSIGSTAFSITQGIWRSVDF